MILLGISPIKHPKINYLQDKFLEQDTKEILDFKSIYWFDGNEGEGVRKAQLCSELRLNFAAIIHTPYQLIVFSALGAKYVITKTKQSHSLKKLQNIINDYLLDTRLLLVAKNIQDINKAIHLRIDGVINEKALDKEILNSI